MSDNVKLHLKVERLCNALGAQTKNQDRIFKTVYGDGNGGKGLVIKVDRLSQSYKNNKRFSAAAIGTAIATAISLVVKSVWEAIK